MKRNTTKTLKLLRQVPKSKEETKMRASTKLGLLAATVGLMMLAISVPSIMAETGAFHDATNLQCNKCHTMHYSEKGAVPTEANGFGMDADTGGPFKQLLLKKNVTDLCLACHSDPTKGPDVFSATIETPGGDFNYSATTDTKGHNPGGVSGNASATLPLDTTLPDALTPPGGTQLTRWTCVECHDEHGDTSAAFMFRNLLKNGLTGSNFVAGDTEESNIWNGTTANVAQSATNHNVYKTGTTIGDTVGFGKWCSTCHGTFHGGSGDTDINDGSDWIRHPTAEPLPTAYITAYGTTSDYTYPLETNNTGASTSTEWTLTQGSEAVTCLSCHKAHATNYANATRWDNAAASGSGTGCNKCHAKGS